MKDLAKWDQWWVDYTNYIVHYAKIAQEKQVPVLCLGCEMNSTEAFEDKWRNLIAKVRGVYHGQITYDVNHGNEEQVKWLDDLDFISLSARITRFRAPMVSWWKRPRIRRPRWKKSAPPCCRSAIILPR